MLDRLASWAAVWAVLLVLAWLARRVRPVALPGLERALASRGAPLAAGLISGSLVIWVWGSTTEPPVYHDETSLLLQARIFASGHLAGPPAPLPEFFQQFHVLVSPRLASKYQPGHPLALVPGVWLGRPGLMPAVLTGVSGALLFILARGLGGVWVAAWAALFWATAPAALFWRASYFSQSTTTAAWLGACLALWVWRAKRRRRDLVWVALLLGWCALTRPLTAVALALPFAAVILRDVWKRRAFRDLAISVAAGTMVVALYAPMNAAVTGSPFVLPYSVYSRLYMPWNQFGFGFHPSPPVIPETAEVAAYTQGFRPDYEAHVPAALPRHLRDRAVTAAGLLWGTGGVGFEWRAPLCVLALMALPAMGSAGLFGLASLASLLLVHLIYPHAAYWPLYYQEPIPVLAYLTALGAARLFGGPGGATPAPSGEALPSRATGPMALTALLILGLGFSNVAVARESIHGRGAYQRQAARLFARIPDDKAIVFIRYRRDHSPHWTLVHSPPDYERARVWFVHDRGADNYRLLALAPERVPYLFDEETFTLFRITGPPPTAR
jgi:hypothetical protein